MRIFALALLLPLAACSGGAGDAEIPDTSAFVEESGDPAADTVVDARYADSLGVQLDSMTRLPGGVYVRDLRVGSGAPADSGSQVTVHYTGWLTDGRVFDSSRERGQPITFRLGVGDVIAGWERGVAGMRAGGRRQLVIPPALGYGRAGSPGAIPSRATLVFDVELVRVQ
jgi:FKBP-type peptidyl-prolyl cis-trans isomerase